MRLKKRIYAAYGSNLHIEDMKKRCPDAEILGTSKLENYGLYYGGEEGRSYLSVEPNKGSYVPLGMWLVSEKDELALDVYEDYPSLYKKVEMDFLIMNKNTGESTLEKAFIYILEEGYGRFAPTDTYVETCKKGYLDFGFDTSLLEEALKR